MDWKTLAAAAFAALLSWLTFELRAHYKRKRAHTCRHCWKGWMKITYATATERIWHCPRCKGELPESYDAQHGKWTHTGS